MIRLYQAQDFVSMLKIIQLNTPKYFDPSEEKLFDKYLAYWTQNYFVIEVNGTTIGGGGFDIEKDQSASMSWGMIHPSWQGSGWGTKITKYRIEQIKQTTAYKINLLRLSTLGNFMRKWDFHYFTPKRIIGVKDLISTICV
jgi:N-acetylglutamate synthase-like GNAT family acetyltransferase